MKGIKLNIFSCINIDIFVIFDKSALGYGKYFYLNRLNIIFINYKVFNSYLHHIVNK